MVRYLHSIKSVDTHTIGTFISDSLAKMTQDPTPIALRFTIIISLRSAALIFHLFTALIRERDVLYGS